MMVGLECRNAQFVVFQRVVLSDVWLIVINITCGFWQRLELQEHIDVVARHTFDEEILIEGEVDDLDDGVFLTCVAVTQIYAIGI